MLTVVTGPPLAGKSTYVRKHAEPGDIVIDYDRLAQAFGSPHDHDHPADVASVTRTAFAVAIGASIRCHHHGSRVWIVQARINQGSHASYQRAGAEIVTLDAPRDELHRRADQTRAEHWHDRIDAYLDGDDVTSRPW